MTEAIMSNPSSSSDVPPALGFMSMGMTVLDELHVSSQQTQYDVPGGSGLYATLGARLAVSSTRSRSIGYVLLAGCDFPERVLDRIRAWGLRFHVVLEPKKPSTRGLLEYQDDNFGRKTFRYLTTPLQPSTSDLASTEMLQSRAFHFLASPQDLEEHIRSLHSLRAERCPSALAPLLVWEPAPLACKRENLEAHLGACKSVDVFSPNHLELAALCGGSDTAEAPVSATFSRASTELYAGKFLDAMSDQGLIVIRCGEHGCLVLSRPSGAQWLLAYHEPTSSKIIDTTGAGNAFLGAFSIGLLQAGDPREAAVYGSVAASFVVEQISVPSFRPATPTSEETWNGESVDSRLQEYRQRTAL